MRRLPREENERGEFRAKPTPEITEKRTVLLWTGFASVVLLFFGAVVKGAFISSDTQNFISAGNDIIAWALEGEGTFSGLMESRLMPEYLISSTILSLVHEYAGLGPIGVLIFNSILFVTIVSLIFRTWMALGVGRKEMWEKKGSIVTVTGGLYIVFGLPDGFLWSYAVLTDTIFLFWVSVFVACVILVISGQLRYGWTLAALTACSAPFVRPTGVLLPLLYVYALGLVWAARFGPAGSRRFAWMSFAVAFGLVFVLAPLVIMVAAEDRALVSNALPDFMEGYVWTSVHFFKNGIVVPTRLSLDIGARLSYSDILSMIVHRLGYYWFPVRLGIRPYSDIHNIVNFIYILVTLPLLAMGVRALLRKGGSYAIGCFFLVMVALGYAFLHALTLVSFGWRYQLPAMVPFWILSGTGLYWAMSEYWFGRSSPGGSRVRRH